MIVIHCKYNCASNGLVFKGWSENRTEKDSLWSKMSSTYLNGPPCDNHTVRYSDELGIQMVTVFGSSLYWYVWYGQVLKWSNSTAVKLSDGSEEC